MISTVFLVNWQPGDVGGFDWFVDDRGLAEHRRQELKDPTAEVHIVALPPSIGTRRPDDDVYVHHNRITDWLDDQGWSDGGAHHVPSNVLQEV